MNWRYDFDTGARFKCYQCLLSFYKAVLHEHHSLHCRNGRKNAISAIWFKPKDGKSPNVHDLAKDRFDPNEVFKYSGASDAGITQ